MAVIIFKPTENCNANCIYCEVIKKNKGITMDYKLLEKVIYRINEFLENNKNEDVVLNWHGGEISLLGSEYFYKTYELINTICKHTKNRLTHLIQSNLTIINQNLIDAFKLLKIEQIGTSFEIIPNIRGIGKNRNSELYNKKFFEGINLLEENGMRWGAIYVVHKKSLAYPIEIFNTLINMSHHNGVMLNKIYIYDEDKHNLSITSEEYADFLGKIFPIWWKDRDTLPPIKPFDNFVKSYEGKQNLMGCELAGMCSYKWSYIGPSGEASHCGRAGDFQILSYGNIKDRTLDEILHDSQRDVFEERKKILANTECKECRFWKNCSGGCPLDAFMINKNFMTKSDVHCTWVKRFVTKYFEPITGY